MVRVMLTQKSFHPGTAAAPRHRGRIRCRPRRPHTRTTATPAGRDGTPAPPAPTTATGRTRGRTRGRDGTPEHCTRPAAHGRTRPHPPPPAPGVHHHPGRHPAGRPRRPHTAAPAPPPHPHTPAAHGRTRGRFCTRKTPPGWRGVSVPVVALRGAAVCTPHGRIRKRHRPQFHRGGVQLFAVFVFDYFETAPHTHRRVFRGGGVSAQCAAHCTPVHRFRCHSAPPAGVVFGFGGGVGFRLGFGAVFGFGFGVPRISATAPETVPAGKNSLACAVSIIRRNMSAACFTPFLKPSAAPRRNPATNTHTAHTGPNAKKKNVMTSAAPHCGLLFTLHPRFV
jgi:hypothetical protein